MTETENIARMACKDRGYQFGALVDDVSGEKPVSGFTYTAPGQDRAVPNWVSLEKSCYRTWDGSSGS